MIRPTIVLPSNKESLRNWLYDHVPGVESAYNSNDLIAVARILRDWTGSIATFSHSDLSLDHNSLPVHELLAGALNYEGGMWCGGVAELYMRLLRTIPGMTAAKYNYGVRNDEIGHVTHMTVLVGDSNGKVWCFDPYLGYEFTEPFGDVLCHIAHKRYGAVSMVTNPIPRPAITLPGEKSGYEWLFPTGVPESVKYEDRWVYHGAAPSWGGLFASDTPNRVRADAYRGEQPLAEWLMDLMLVGAELGRFSDEYEWNEFACVRKLFYSMLEV